MINQYSNILKNCASAAKIVAEIFAYFKEMCNNTVRFWFKGGEGGLQKYNFYQKLVNSYK